jgi:hypothetical protein
LHRATLKEQNDRAIVVVYGSSCREAREKDGRERIVDKLFPHISLRLLSNCDFSGVTPIKIKSLAIVLLGIMM